MLENVGINYDIDPDIVRGLDYYTKTVFEITADIQSSNTTICGGGRYDGLVSELGGPKMPACGFAIGMERLFLALESQNINIDCKTSVDIYIGSMDDESLMFAQRLSHDLRLAGIGAEYDKMGRGVKAQMKYANKIGARYSVIIGGDELSSKKAMLKNMALGESCEVELDAQSIGNAIK